MRVPATATLPAVSGELLKILLPQKIRLDSIHFHSHADRVRFSVNEPYSSSLANRRSEEFDQLNKEISAGLRDLFRQIVGDDDELDLTTTLVQVG